MTCPTLKLRIQDRVYSVVGVLPERFEFPPRPTCGCRASSTRRTPAARRTTTTASAACGAASARSQASADLDAIAQRIVRQSPEQNDYLLRSAAAVPLQASQTAKVRSPLLILLGAVGVLLLVACANVANLLLAEASARARELALRHALGAGRGRLVRQFVTEALLLSGVSGVVGVLIAVGLLRALLALAPPRSCRDSRTSR